MVNSLGHAAFGVQLQRLQRLAHLRFDQFRSREIDQLRSGGFSPVNYPLSAERLEPLSRFIRQLHQDSDFADDGFPELKN